jgi:hypothetical protein
MASWLEERTPADSNRSRIGNPGENAQAKLTCGWSATKSSAERTVIAIASTKPIATDLNIIRSEPTDYGARFRKIARAGAPSCPPTLIGSTIRS